MTETLVAQESSKWRKALEVWLQRAKERLNHRSPERRLRHRLDLLLKTWAGELRQLKDRGIEHYAFGSFALAVYALQAVKSGALSPEDLKHIAVNDLDLLCHSDFESALKNLMKDQLLVVPDEETYLKSLFIQIGQRSMLVNTRNPRQNYGHHLDIYFSFGVQLGDTQQELVKSEVENQLSQLDHKLTETIGFINQSLSTHYPEDLPNQLVTLEGKEHLQYSKATMDKHEIMLVPLTSLLLKYLFQLRLAIESNEKDEKVGSIEKNQHRLELILKILNINF